MACEFIKYINAQPLSFENRLSAFPAPASKHRLAVVPPKHPEINLTDKSSLIFNETTVLWYKALTGLQEFVKADLLIAQQSPNQKENTVRLLCKSRIIGQIWQSAWRLFDETHKSPQVHDKLLKKLGKTRDQIKTNVSTDPAQLMNAVSFYPDLPYLSSGFIPDSGLSIDKHLQGLSNSLQILFEKPSLSLHEYHRLRKRPIRQLMHCWQLAYADSETPVYLSYFAFFHRLHAVMGDDITCANTQNNGQNSVSKDSPFAISPEVFQSVKLYLRI